MTFNDPRYSLTYSVTDYKTSKSKTISYVNSGTDGYDANGFYNVGKMLASLGGSGFTIGSVGRSTQEEVDADG